MHRSNWKLTAFAVLFLAFAVSAFGQKTAPVYKTVKPFTGSKEFRKFSIGINMGVLSPNVIIGGSNDYANPQITFGFGGNLRYQFNHYFAAQADLLTGTLKGNQEGGPAGANRPVSSFNTKLKYAASLNGQFTFGNINWLREKTTVVPYLSAGAGVASYDVKIVKTGTTTEVAYPGSMPLSELFIPVGLGLKVNVSRVVNLDFGYRMQFLDGDNLDGLSTGVNNPGSSTTKKDKFSYGFAGLEFALGKKDKQQLLFDNPAFRANNMMQKKIDSISKVVDELKTDTDNDGVADMFDREPNTPAGSPVDVRGVTKDSDNDGVPDIRDKQLITPTECQPVDADGVGKCPEPACCTELKDMMAKMHAEPTCPTDYPSLAMKGATLNKDVKAMLAVVASKLQENPTCTITLTAYPAASKAAQSAADKKLTAVQTYLIETLGINADRIATDKNIDGGDANVIDIK